MRGLAGCRIDVLSLATRGWWAHLSSACIVDYIKARGEVGKASHHYFMYSHWKHEIIEGSLYNQ